MFRTNVELLSLFAVHIPSVPCSPAQMNSSMTCQANTAQVQWDPNGGAESYEVRALGTKGYAAGCNTTGTFCNVSNLPCGDVYNISVIAVSSVCRVRGNPVMQLPSGEIVHTNTHKHIVTTSTIIHFLC